LQVKRKKKRRVFLAVLLFFTIFFLLGNWTGVRIYNSLKSKGCFQLPADVTEYKLPTHKTTIRFLALGDAGTGDKNQLRLAKTVGKTCREVGCDFVLYLGDNFYPHGVSSLSDPLFKSQFEEVYEELDTPFFSVLGNHDTQGDVYSQIYYTLKNPKWKMPNFNYHFSSGSGNFMAVNSNCAALGLYDLYKLITHSRNQWQFVFGHHTIYSSGIHGDANILLRTIWRTFFHDQVDFYLAGHDHELEHLRRKNPGTEYIVSGAGGKHYRNPEDRLATRTSNAVSQFRYQDNGFVWFEVDRTKVQVRFYNADGQIIYRFSKNLTV